MSSLGLAGVKPLPIVSLCLPFYTTVFPCDLPFSLRSDERVRIFNTRALTTLGNLVQEDQRRQRLHKKHDAGSLKLGIACSSSRSGSEDIIKRMQGNDCEKITSKVEKLDGNTRRAARKAVATVLQVDRARLLDVDGLTRKSARLLPRAILEALTDRIRARQWESALKVFGLLRLQEWYDPKQEIYVKLLTMLGRCNQPDVAADLFEMMIVEDRIIPSLEAFTALLFAYMNRKRTRTAFQLFAHMKKLAEYQPDVYVYTMMIKGCCECGLFDRASVVLAEMLQCGVEPSIVTYNTLVDAFGKVGMLPQMEELLIHMLQTGTCKPDTWTFNTIIKHHGKKGNIQKMEEWFEILQLSGIQPDTVTFNTLVCAYGRNGLYAEMKSVVLYMRKYLHNVDIVTYNSMIEAYGKGGMIEQMGNTFSAMKRAGVKFTAFTLCCLISAYSSKSMWEEVEKVKRQWKNSDMVPDVALYNSLINAHRRAENFDGVEVTFLEMKSEGFTPDDITHTIVIEAYRAQQMHDKADQLLGEMRSRQCLKA